LIYKQVSWFDRKSKAPGILSNIFSEDITNLNGLTTELVGTLLESLITLLVGIALSAFFEWRMAIVSIFLTPFMVLGAVIMTRLVWRAPGFKSQHDKYTTEIDAYAQSNALLADVIMNYRTIISFGT
jgi:ATP-binding cassette subfamily B (MDR/TAP) protein 1